jgi:hypothetical protein
MVWNFPFMRSSYRHSKEFGILEHYGFGFSDQGVQLGRSDHAVGLVGQKLPRKTVCEDTVLLKNPGSKGREVR